ncbi:MAG: Abi family protein [Anaerovoracaceae bacterium]
MKEKLTVEQQIQHMKSKGVQFNIVSEEEAISYLTNNTYYFKIKAYAKNYDKYRTTEKAGQYVNLEFAYLKDLAIIDMLLRHYILKTSVDLEHTMKTRFLRDFNNSEDDGYHLVQMFLDENPSILDDIKRKKENSYTKDLSNKLLTDGFAIWNIIELLSLKDFLMLYQRFYMEYPNARTGHDLYYPMQGVRKLRNAAAHSNCLINTLKRPYSGQVRYNSKVDAFVKNIGSIDKKSRSSNMSNQVVYDFVTMLYLVDEITESMGMKEQTIKELYDLVHGRMVKHADYYKKESAICSTYNFIKKIVDFLYEKTYTNRVI